mmetsp:Transcript_3917/g.9015  ORF Transcript_3917/g.9015 Transcript_3917/m.9015 type:complete len:85 (+) Transcript_3917:2-256(+)
MKGSAKMMAVVLAVMGHWGVCARSSHLVMDSATHSSTRHRIGMMVETAAWPHARKQIVALEGWTLPLIKACHGMVLVSHIVKTR